MKSSQVEINTPAYSASPPVIKYKSSASPPGIKYKSSTPVIKYKPQLSLLNQLKLLFISFQPARIFSRLFSPHHLHFYFNINFKNMFLFVCLLVQKLLSPAKQKYNIKAAYTFAAYTIFDRSWLSTKDIISKNKEHVA